MAETRAAWLDGMPPVRQAMVLSSSLVFLLREDINTITALISWAKNQLDIEDKNIGFSKNGFKGTARIDKEKDIYSTLIQE
jgi:hypothetical protein